MFGTAGRQHPSLESLTASWRVAARSEGRKITRRPGWDSPALDPLTKDSCSRPTCVSCLFVARPAWRVSQPVLRPALPTRQAR